MFNLAVVTQVLPDRHGVLVAFRNGVEFHPGVGHDEDLLFVRVLERRAHNSGGATICLPEVGELGLVIDVDSGISIWMGSIPWEKSNQMDPRVGMEGWRHASGVQLLVLENGDTQFWHPTGLSFTVSRAGVSIPEIEGSMPLDRTHNADATPAPHVVISHPSGFRLGVSPLGALSISSPAEVTVHSTALLTVLADADVLATVTGALTASVGKDLTATVGKDLKATVTGNATLKAAKITLDGPVECTGTLKVTGDATISGKSFLEHKHTAQGATAVTSKPN